jgi:hypothetical protein
MDIGFVYKGVLVLFDKKIGYFLYIGEDKFTFPDKETIKDFINKKLME